MEAKMSVEYDGYTCLMVAVMTDHIDICRLLIDKGAQIDAKNWIVNKVGSITQDNTIGISEIIAEKELQIIPNPTNGVFSIGNLAENAVVEVYEMNGKKIFSKSIIPSETIDLRSFGKGTYLVEIQISNSQQKRLKLVSL